MPNMYSQGDEDHAILQEIVDRLPSPGAVQLLGRLRSRGWDWDDIETNSEGLAEEIAASDLPVSSEAERYVRRLITTAYAVETGGMFN